MNYKYGFSLGVLLLLAGAFIVFAGDDADKALIAELESEVAKYNKLCIDLEQEAVYNDPKVKVAYNKVKEIEKQLHAARQALAKELEQMPEMYRAREGRRLAYEKLTAARRAAHERVQTE